MGPVQIEGAPDYLVYRSLGVEQLQVEFTSILSESVWSVDSKKAEWRLS